MMCSQLLWINLRLRRDMDNELIPAFWIEAIIIVVTLLILFTPGGE